MVSNLLAACALDDPKDLSLIPSLFFPPILQINFVILVSRQGKTRLTKWFVQMSAKVIINKNPHFISRDDPSVSVSVRISSFLSPLAPSHPLSDQYLCRRRPVQSESWPQRYWLVHQKCAISSNGKTRRSSISGMHHYTLWPAWTRMTTNWLYWNRSIYSWKSWIDTLAMCASWTSFSIFTRHTTSSTSCSLEATCRKRARQRYYGYALQWMRWWTRARTRVQHQVGAMLALVRGSRERVLLFFFEMLTCQIGRSFDVHLFPYIVYTLYNNKIRTIWMIEANKIREIKT